MKKILVTGANGFIGSELISHLVSKDYEVIAVVNENDQNIKHLKIKIIRTNLENILDIYSELPVDIDIMYHFAWEGVSSKLKDSIELQMKNIKYSFDTLILAHKLNIRKVVFPGSLSEYSRNDVPITGFDHPSPSDFYSSCKVAVRFICSTYANKHDIDFNWVLIPSVYGPRRNDDNLISYTIRSLLNGASPSFSSLSQVWDYLYIDDLVNALTLIGVYGKKNKVYPLGTGSWQPLSNYVKIISDIIDPSILLGIGKLGHKNSSHIDNSFADISVVKEDTGFEPKFTFEEGIEKTINYFKGKL